MHLLLAGTYFPNRNGLEFQTAAQPAALLIVAAQVRGFSTIGALRGPAREKRTTLRAYLLAIRSHAGGSIYQPVESANPF